MVPSVAVETVYIWNNTSIIQDEVLAQRLGLIPLNVNPHKLQTKRSAQEEPTDLNTIVFNLVARCDPPRSTVYSSQQPISSCDKLVLSSDLVFDPKGAQEAIFSSCKPGTANQNIVLAKLREGQEILAELHCHKGIGREHAKWSPVATASYRLLPKIELLERIEPTMQAAFQACFPPGVIDVLDGEIHVVSARKDTVSREVLRRPEFARQVRLGRVRDHFIFSLESAGQYAAGDLVHEAVTVLIDKLRKVKMALGHCCRT